MENQENTYNPGIGKVAYGWELKEFEEHERSTLWYIIMGSIALILIILSIFTNNFLFALIILLFIFIIVLREFYAANRVDFKVTSKGLVIADKLIPFKEINNFYIIYEPPEVKFLYFKFKAFRPVLSINLYNQDPLGIREYLLQYLEEDLEIEDEHFGDSLNRLLKI